MRRTGCSWWPSGDDGSLWFRYCYELLPRQLDYSFGGGVLAEKRLDKNGESYEHELTAEEWEAYMLEQGVTAVYIEKTDEAFRQRFGGLFPGRRRSVGAAGQSPVPGADGRRGFAAGVPGEVGA